MDEQIRLAMEWIRLDGQSGSFVIFESRGHSGWVQMLLVDDKAIEFDFPTTIRRAKGQTEGLFYEAASTLPDVAGAEEQSPFSNEQMVRLRTLLKKYDVSPYSLKQVSKDTNGVVVGAIESVTFRVPVTATEKLQRLLPELFSAVHGIDVITSLDLQTGKTN